MPHKQPYLRITPQRHFFDLGLAELWRERALLWTLVGRDLRVRYKNTALGIIWVILQPALSTGIFTLIFARFFAGNSDNYMLTTLLGFTFWQCFSSTLSYSSGSFYEQITMIRKIYFPRAYLPLTIVCRQLFDFAVASVFLLIIWLFQGQGLTLTGVITYILTAAIMTLYSSGFSWLLASLNAIYRDFRHLIPFVIQLWFYATPVFYSQSLLTGSLGFLVYFNPLAALLHLARVAAFEDKILWLPLAATLLGGLIICPLGLAVFRQLETEMVDKA